MLTSSATRLARSSVRQAARRLAVRTTATRCLTTQAGQYVPAAPLGFAPATAPGALNLPIIRNEPMHNYVKGDVHREKIEAALKKLLASPPMSIPIVIGDKEIHPTASNKQQVTSPTDHKHVLAEFAETTGEHATQAIEAALAAKAAWEALPFQAKAAIFLRAADLLAGPYRYEMLASVMVGQGKNVWQAEIDAAAEAIDFWRFNVQYAAQIYSQLQPSEHAPTVWNRVEYRPLEGFVLAVTPFNFAAIGANLASSPALMGNVVLWKPSNTALHSNYLMFKILREAGLPAGVINFLPGNGLEVGAKAFNHSQFAGLHFTGSTATFHKMWQTIGANIANYRSFPRIVGETGGKNFHFVHASADVDLVVHQTIRSAFEYSGQKCSAVSRMYVPASLWPKIKSGLIEHTRDIIANQFGPVTDFKNFVTSVIDERSFDRLASVLKEVKSDAAASKVSILVGGECDKSRGWFVQPTIIETKDPQYRTMKEELFGPVLTVYVYPDAEYEKTLELCDATSSYALTGSLFGRDRYALEFGSAKLRNASGNFYVNDKSTGAVVGQQPFGGARGSGTNDKAGAMQNLLRWASPRAIKETFVPITTYKYPHQN